MISSFIKFVFSFVSIILKIIVYYKKWRQFEKEKETLNTSIKGHKRNIKNNNIEMSELCNYRISSRESLRLNGTISDFIVVMESYNEMLEKEVKSLSSDNISLKKKIVERKDKIINLIESLEKQKKFLQRNEDEFKYTPKHIVNEFESIIEQFKKLDSNF
ncbi:hypothetical protein CD117_07965 [Mammaliicoccus sciuri]|uniref:Uncharacterized protein n=1 Tax=Mammaliicoccus sciuri TaxID=1296 RepID=A0AAJ4VHQ9_MAMSC|nr:MULTISPECIES: hypothetical protein [Mammaliicoccus]RTX72732.1 hypothetical protein CD117_07965 [Mammaliicoccus sciuri]